MSVTKRIARLLKVPLGEAISYCKKVRRISGLGDKLPYKTIARHLEQHRKDL